jgi:hypothetical protein
MGSISKLADTLGKMQRPDETEEAWLERIGETSAKDFFESLDPFASFR